MNKQELKKIILKNCERKEKEIYIGTTKYVKAFYLFCREEFESGDVSKIVKMLRDIMEIDRDYAIKLGKKITKSRERFTDSAINIDYWETEGYIECLMKNNRHLIRNE